jgi:hypothetical protein
MLVIKHTRKSIAELVIIIVLLGIPFYMIGGCDRPELEFSNPLDPVSSEYILPDAKITAGPEEGSKVNTPEVTFQWAKDALPIEYSYQLDNGEWSEWTKEFSYTTPELDEGLHSFSVKSRNSNRIDEETTPITRTFTMDAVEGPALMMKARYITVNEGADFVVQLMAEEVTDLMLVHIILTYDASMLRVSSIEQRDFLATNGGTVVFFEDSSDPGEIEITAGVGISDPPGIEGTGAIVQLTFRALRNGRTDIRIGETSEFRDSDNVKISIKQLVDGIVQIQ